MRQIDIDEAKLQLPELIEAAISGEEVAITKGDRAIIKLVPVLSVKQSWPAKAGSAKGLVTLSDDFEEPITDFEDYFQ